MTLRLATVIAVSLAIAVASREARAQAPDAIETLLRSGVELRRRGDDAGALAVFRRAYSQSRSAIALAQMGFAEQALGRWLEAEAHVREVLASNDPWIAQNRAEIERAYDVIRRHVGTIELLGGIRGATVRVNGEVVAQLPLEQPIRALAGRVTLEVRAPGFYPITRDVTVSAGETARETISLRRVTSGVDNGDGATQRTGALIAAVGGVLLLAGGFAALAVRENAVQSYNQDPLCPGTNSTLQPQACADRVSSASTGETLATVGLIAGGTSAALAVVLFATAPSSAPRRTAGVRFRCAPSLGNVGVDCGFLY